MEYIPVCDVFVDADTEIEAIDIVDEELSKRLQCVLHIIGILTGMVIPIF